MQNSIHSKRLEEKKRLFLNYPLFTFSFLPYLVDKDYSVIAGPKLPEDGYVNIIIVKDLKREFDLILSYQKDLLGRNPGFDDRIFFLYNLQEDFDFFYDLLNFPANKINIIKYFCSLQKEELVKLLRKGITSLREAEYFCSINDHLKRVIVNSDMNKQEFKIALNVCFEITKHNIPINIDNNISIFENLLKIRYPMFYDYKKESESIIKELETGNVRIDFDKFFEGRTLKFNLKFQNKNEFLKILKLLEEKKEIVIKMIELLNK
ncbi:MAG TPA: hypothetical protein PKW55_01850 [Spirochaetota bacterium]|nr:hypothetical protein [Spirochaetota bacterium]HOM38403.1 hypothetical protein [Spirochaetota bacterium]HPQ48379.1 hypothetical protein [Spirochaetota bacterium]